MLMDYEPCPVPTSYQLDMLASKNAIGLFVLNHTTDVTSKVWIIDPTGKCIYASPYLINAYRGAIEWSAANHPDHPVITLQLP